MRYQILDWDSDFFGVRVARIGEQDLPIEQLPELLSEINRQGVRLVYWPSTRECEEAAVQRLGGRLVDTKITFAKDFRGSDPGDYAPDDLVEAYTAAMPISDLEDLAVQCGQYSRFAVDPHFPWEKFVALYKTWMRRSLSKEIAREVLVLRSGDRVVGMATLGDKSGRGNIGLNVVDRDFRGRGYGERIVRAAQRWFVENGYASGQVVTQKRNVPACNLYKKCGYSVEQVESFYHFWL